MAAKRPRPPSVTERARVLGTVQDERARVDSILVGLDQIFADREREPDDGTKAGKFIHHVAKLKRAMIRADNTRQRATKRLATVKARRAPLLPRDEPVSYGLPTMERIVEISAHVEKAQRDGKTRHAKRAPQRERSNTPLLKALNAYDLNPLGDVEPLTETRLRGTLRWLKGHHPDIRPPTIAALRKLIQRARKEAAAK
jgi:hypothetical protein